MLDQKLAQTWLNTVQDPQKYGVPELHFQFWQLADEKAKQTYLEDYERNPILLQFNQERYYAPDYDFEELAHLPADTLGYAYYHHIVDHGLSPKLAFGYRAYQEAEDAAGKLQDMPEVMKYSTVRGFQLHDIWHPLTGFDTTPVGEIGLQAFTLAQFHKPYNAFWMSISATRTLLIAPEQTTATFDAIAAGWQLGKRAKSLINTHWEEMFDRPLDGLRREYNLL